VFGLELDPRQLVGVEGRGQRVLVDFQGIDEVAFFLVRRVDVELNGGPLGRALLNPQSRRSNFLTMGTTSLAISRRRRQ